MKEKNTEGVPRTVLDIFKCNYMDNGNRKSRFRYRINRRASKQNMKKRITNIFENVINFMFNEEEL